MLIYLQMLETQEDKDKFMDVYETYRSLMYFSARNILSIEQDIEDAVHQALVSVIENIDKIGNVHSPQTRSYVVVIVENKSIDIIRRRSKYVDGDFDENQYGIEIPPPGDAGLADAMAKLPPKYRELLLLRFDNGYTTKEIAQMLGMKQNTVQKTIQRAKEELAIQLKREGMEV